MARPLVFRVLGWLVLIEAGGRPIPLIAVWKLEHVLPRVD